MVADVARHVAGDAGEVVALMGDGVDPHLYQPTRSDISVLMAADVVLFNGLKLEGKFEEVFARLRASGRVVRSVAEPLVGAGVGGEVGAEVGAGVGGGDGVDPHVWMDPSLWSGTAEVVREALEAARPERASMFAENAAAYREMLDAMDAYASATLARVPEGSRVLVTAHDAFGYFGARYGYEVLGIQGISTESEAGVRDIERLVTLLVERRIPAVFVESTVSTRGIEALIAGAAARGHTVRLGGELYSDAMGRVGTPEATYVGMIEHNVRTIAGALGEGVASEGGGVIGFAAWRDAQGGAAGREGAAVESERGGE
jgi:manganese/zinc/iron transport system substrate-binding protein